MTAPSKQRKKKAPPGRTEATEKMPAFKPQTGLNEPLRTSTAKQFAHAPPDGAVKNLSEAWRSTSELILSSLSEAMPELLVANVSAVQRDANMKMLRDKFVAGAQEKGLKVGWNRLRGDGPLSIDAVSFRTRDGDGLFGLARAYEDLTRPIRLEVVRLGGKPGFTTDND